MPYHNVRPVSHTAMRMTVQQCSVATAVSLGWPGAPPLCDGLPRKACWRFHLRHTATRMMPAHVAASSNTCVCACSHGHIQLLLKDGQPIFFTTRDGPWCPTLRIVHQYPEMMKRLRVDQGAPKFVLAGANIMCPGLTSEGATMHDEVRARIWFAPCTALACTGYWTLMHTSVHAAQGDHVC